MQFLLRVFQSGAVYAHDAAGIWFWCADACDTVCALLSCGQKALCVGLRDPDRSAGDFLCDFGCLSQRSIPVIQK